MTRLFTLLILLTAVQVQAGPKLYVFDCGYLTFTDMVMFGLSDDETDVREMFVPCYLVEHEKGRLLFDGGLPKSYADAQEPIAIEGGVVSYDKWIVDQLADMGLAPADVDYAAYSHLHFDHTGAANYFTDSEVLMQRSEWDSAFGDGAAFIDTSIFDKLPGAKVTLLDGDHDVFSDGSVKLIYTPGHTAGHQLLLLDLENTGKLMLSGDLYHTRANRRLQRPPVFNLDAAQTIKSMAKIEKLLQETGATLWIEHDYALAKTLKRAPAFYD